MGIVKKSEIVISDFFICFLIINQLYLLIMDKKDYKSISIVLDPEIHQKLEDGKYNKSKLIDSLLDDYFKKQKKIKK